MTAVRAIRPGVLEPRGPEAERIADLWWLMLWIGVVVVLAVAAMIVVATRSRRDDQCGAGESGDAGERIGQRLIVSAGVVVPVVVLTVIAAASASLGLRDDKEADVVIEVDGRQYWWEVRYPDDGVVTANEIHVPVGEPVELLLTSRDVIHSLWIPQLAGKLDLLPERTNRLVIEASEAGVYRGECAEFCGEAHAHMRLLVVAQDPDDYARWVRRQSADAREPSTGEEVAGRDVSLGSCAYCHTIRGTNATSDAGPDLTHLASRVELGAGVLDNEPDQLADWITATQRHKPGSLMPSVPLSDADVEALIAYLETLE